ncbi:hypothetical protein HYG89_04825 [Acinetobacter sp. SwsAc5]|uniref:DUF6685 family protein n=1 Tax=Acinetobacter sp. SwsAc5 TaxID=2749438 RepID=UPI0015BFE49B|nr:DUF6685 family protein [Acinetobacter sp. SwsAc5]NWK51889.1 hypothetical protein [Acinetobacter sp. SwsAc5]
MTSIFNKVKSALKPNPMAKYLGKQALVSDLKLELIFADNFNSESIPQLHDLYNMTHDINVNVIKSRNHDIGVEIASAASLLFTEISLHRTDISIADVNAFKMGIADLGNMSMYDSIESFHAHSEKYPDPFDANIKTKYLTSAQTGIDFEIDDIDRFKLFGWSNRLILESRNGHNRFAHAAALAKKLGKDLKVKAPLEAVVFNELEFNDFTDMYAQFLVPLQQNYEITEILDELDIPYISVKKEEITGEDYLLIVQRANCPKDILAVLSKELTDFNEILSDLLQAQISSPIYQKYIKENTV